MDVNDIVCTYASVCIVILHVQSRYGLWVKQTVIKILSKLYNKWTRDQNGGRDGGRGGQMGKLTTQTCLSMHLVLHVPITSMYCLTTGFCLTCKAVHCIMAI